MKIQQHYLPWLIYGLFVALVFYFNANHLIFSTQAPLWVIKILIWLIWLSFIGYSYYCSTRENLIKTMKKMNQLHWGRQIGIDLYLGVGLSLLIIYLHQGSVWIMLLWLIPCLIYANLVTLLYFAVFFDSFVAKFIV
jgi:hypothetical protein